MLSFTTHYYFIIMEIGSRVGLASVGDVSNVIYFQRCPASTAGPIKKKLHQKWHVIVVLCSSNPEYVSVARERYRIPIMKVSVHCLVLIYETLRLEIVTEA